MADQVPFDEIKKHVLPIAQKYFDLSEYPLIVFGSRAAGTARSTSDIDIGINGVRPIPNHLLAKFREAVRETPLLYKVDIVDLNTVSANFRQIALKNYQVITP